MKDELIDLIVKRLTEMQDQLRKDFLQEHSIKVARHFVMDNLLPIEIAEEIYANFPKPSKMHKTSCSGRLKTRYSHLKETSQLLHDINFAIQSRQVIDMIEKITGIKNQIADPSRHAGGISALPKGYYINPHLDNSHDVEVRRYYRTANMLYYVSPNWKRENGGNYELWDKNVENHILVPCLFNRLLMMETHSTSWHSVSRVLSDEPRCCIFNYYFSEESPEGREYFFNKSMFRARPEQKIRRKMDDFKIAIKNVFS